MVQKLFGGGPESPSGMPIDEDSALMISAFWNGVSIISGAVGFLPWRVYEKLAGGRAIRDTHPNDVLLHQRPNPMMSALTFRETLQQHALVWGNGYAEIEFNGAGVPVALWPLLPNMVEPKIEKNKEGKQVLGAKEAKPPGRESLVHQYWKRFYGERFKEQGYKVQLEAPRRSGNVDVLAVKGDEAIAIEIETGKSDIVRNVKQDLLSGFNKVLIVATDEKALAKVEQELGRAGLIGVQRVEIVLRDGG